MTVDPADGGLQEVRGQWEESSRLLDEARQRLELLGDARAMNDRAATSLEASSASLAELTTSLRSAVDVLSSALSSAGSLFSTLEGLAASSDLQSLLAAVGGMNEQLTHQNELLEQVAQQQGTASAELAAVLLRVDKSEQMEAERNATKAKLDQVVASLPGRTQNKIRPILD